MKKEWLLASAVTILTFLLLLLIVRHFAPRLLGLPIDMQVVQVAEEAQPYFEVVFQNSKTMDLLLKDPISNIRGRAFLYNKLIGPQDILGFRNRQVPAVADAVVIGDSQTYGNNAEIDFNWPGYFAETLNRERSRPVEVYNMSVGGWSAPQYLYMFDKALSFEPRDIVIAFYTGNDPQESVAMVYGYEYFKPLRDGSDQLDDKPDSSALAEDSGDNWPVTFEDGTRTVFNPKLRLFSNDNRFGAVRAGLRIIETTARTIDLMCAKLSVSSHPPRVWLTIIPTKELVYAEKVKAEKLEQPDDYTKLVRAEQENIDRLAAFFKGLTHLQYIDLVAPLQRAALSSRQLYPPDVNGHPIPTGYMVIGYTIAKACNGDFPDLSPGLYKDEDSDTWYLLNREGIYTFGDPSLPWKNGWKKEQVKMKIGRRELIGIEHVLYIKEVRPELFGPEGEVVKAS